MNESQTITPNQEKNHIKAGFDHQLTKVAIIVNSENQVKLENPHIDAIISIAK